MHQFLFVAGPSLKSAQSKDQTRALRSQAVRRGLQKRHQQDRRKRRSVADGNDGGITRDSQSARAVQALPLDILDIGNVDPFSAYEIQPQNRWAQEIIHFSVRTLWRGFRTMDNFEDRYAQVILPMAAQYPELQAALLFSASVHRDAMHIRSGTAGTRLDLSRQLVLKSLALRSLQKALARKPEDQNLDALVHSILWLAANEGTAGRVSTEPDESPFSPPLKSRQWLNFYGTLDFDPTHWHAVVELVAQRGGIGALKTYGASWLLSYASLLTACATLTAPIYPLMDPLGHPAVYRPPLHLLHLHQVPWHLIRPERGFYALKHLHISKEIIHTFLDLGELSQAFHAYVKKESQDTPTDLLVDCSQILQHRLLSLPVASQNASHKQILSKDSIGAEKMFCLAVYEAVRLSALLYSLHVTYPYPKSGRVVRAGILPSLRRALCACDGPWLTDEISEVLLWCSVVGAIAASVEQPVERWLASNVVKLVYLRGTKSFEELKALLKSMAWLDTACDAGALAVWSSFHE